jgi:hypothetical protein
MDHYFLTLMNGGGPPCTIQLLKATCDDALWNVAFNFKLRRYSLVKQVAMSTNDVAGRDLHSSTSQLIGGVEHLVQGGK